MSEKLLEYFKGDDLAASVWASKYKLDGEETPDDMHRRMAKEFYRIDKAYQDSEPKTRKDLSKYGQERTDLTEDSIYSLFKNFKKIIPQGSVMAGLGTNEAVSLSNCVVLESPVDSYSGIMYTDSQLVSLLKRRCGVGFDLSKLRPEGTPVKNSAKSSTGVTSFMERFSNTTREVAMSGRRGALLLSIDIAHPDSLDFIKKKRDTVSVTGANISVRLNKEFIEAAKNNTDYILRFPCDAHLTVEKYSEWYPEWNNGELNYIAKDDCYIKVIKAREYWDEIIKSAHGYAEPGLIFWDQMTDYAPDGVYPQHCSISTNPCAEIGMGFDSCRLMVSNLFDFVSAPFTDAAKFDLESFYTHNYEAMRLMDNLVDLEYEHLTRIIDKVKSDPEPDYIKEIEIKTLIELRAKGLQGRRTGLGLTGLGDMFASLGVAYDSDDAMKVVSQIMYVKMASELDATIDLAVLRDPFQDWDPTLEYIYRLTEDNASTLEPTGMNPFYKMLALYYPERVKRMAKWGRRNISWSTVSPTGSVSLMTQTTSGIEPLFQPFYTRRKKVNPSDSDSRVDFVDQSGDKWQEYFVLHPKFKEWCELKSYDITTSELLQKAFEVSPWFGSTADAIDWNKRVEMQSIIQKFISHSISSTINLPSDVSLATVADVYMEAYEQGLKGITVYRDGSRSGVLVTDSSVNFDYNDAVKRPKKLDGEAYVTKVKGVDFTVFIGFLANKPYEVFAYAGEVVAYAGNGVTGSGSIVKKKRGHYVFMKDDIEFEITDNITDEQEAITRLVSWGLRHGGGIKYCVEVLSKTKGTLVDYTKALARILKKYITDEAVSGSVCGECGASDLVYEEGCKKCKSCGNSACG